MIRVTIKTNMKLRHKNKKVIIITAVVAVLLLGSVFVYALQNRTPGDSGQPTTSDDSKEKPATESDSPTPETPPTGKTPESKSDTPPAPVPSSEGKDIVEVAITSTAQNSTTLQIRTVIYSVQGSGTCTLSLARSGYETITQTAEIQPLPSTSTCKGFDIPLTQLAPGNWQATLTFSNNSVAGTTTKDITVN